jgi:hypothetical protein
MMLKRAILRRRGKGVVLEERLKRWIYKERKELIDRRRGTDYKPELNYIQGRLDALELLEKEVLEAEELAKN